MSSRPLVGSIPLILIMTMTASALLSSTAGVRAQLPPPLPPPPTPNFNPSSPYVVPQAPEVPVSPGMGGGSVIGGAASGTPGDIIAVEPNHGTKKSHPHHRRRRQAPPKR